ncbi:aminoglycoside 6-adenylyltransferase [uncultured Clostridium sp.]|uniref:aminoglycoside 6-adenylyltransferase n=1 Tax=uncultured Clostridium sp. TaxID=59620 RepID=UPI0028E23D2C|nr:aminoglycoside 6-adenylyltransferase [uncultured Clostridium sp.]
MNSSRANSNVVKDIFQDYDIVYVVKEIENDKLRKTLLDKDECLHDMTYQWQ